MKNLNQTIRAKYGEGVYGYLMFIFYGFKWNTFTVYKLDLNNYFNVFELDSEYSLSKPVSAQLDEIRSHKKLPREFYCDFIHKAGECCLIKKENDFAYVHWIYFRGDHSRFLKFSDDAVEINNIVALPEFRGHGLAAKAISLTASDLRERKYARLYCVVHNKNIVSIKILMKIGFKEVCSINSLGPFNRKISV